MADLVTHLCTALLPGAFVRARWLPVIVVGTALPDIGARVPGMGLRLLYRAGVPVPEPLFDLAGVLHMPSGMVLGAALAAFLFREAERRPAFLALLGGCGLHLMVDLLQDHHGNGYLLFFPFSLYDWELGLIGSEATVPLAPWLALATATAWMGRWVASRRSTPRVAEEAGRRRS